jgi:hypothetical protein
MLMSFMMMHMHRIPAVQQPKPSRKGAKGDVKPKGVVQAKWVICVRMSGFGGATNPSNLS